jgi:hypothetical protein
MARKSPARVRADAPHRRQVPACSIDGISARGRAVIAHLEHNQLWPGAAYAAVDAWSRLLRDPYHRLVDPSYGCPVFACCPDPDEVRRIIRMILSALPKRDARALRARIGDPDEDW